jgi:hypothetical protein
MNYNIVILKKVGETPLVGVLPRKILAGQLLTKRHK